MEIKVLIHCHSKYSYDAKMSLAELKELCKVNGVQVVCMTEHTNQMTSEQAKLFVEECERLSDESFLFIPGFEVPYKRAHVLMIGARNFCGNFAQTGAELALWGEVAQFVILAHPVRNNFDVDATLLAHIDALEVWNQQYEGKQVPRTQSLKLYADLKKKKEGLVAAGGVDFHRREHFGAPLVHLNIETFTEAAIIEKLKIGACTIVSEHAVVYGTLPNSTELIQKYRIQSFFSVTVIVLGKWVNKLLAVAGISLPKWLKQLVRQRV